MPTAPVSVRVAVMKSSPEKDLAFIRVVLENPQQSKNIGSVCRAMKNMGLTRLYIAGDTPVDWEKAAVTAVHAGDILDQAVLCPSVEEALQGVSLAAALSRRRGKKRKYFSESPEELARQVLSGGGETALVFGNEISGLNDHDLGLCHVAVRIPTSDNFPSMNLSHAVQVVCYEIFKEYRSQSHPRRGYRPLEEGELQKLAGTITGNLKEIGFFKQVTEDEMGLFWRDILARAALSHREGDRVAAIFHKIRGLASPPRSSRD